MLQPPSVYLILYFSEYPPHWNQENQDFITSILDNESEEYMAVEDSFLSTLPNAEVKLIERIQNRVLWRKYLDKSKEMKDFGGGELNEQLLFHGSRMNDPKLIYRGDASFDMRHSRDGVWGRGNYFAVNASYSDVYAFVVNSGGMGCRKMLAAWVLTGHSYHSDAHNFQNPPFRDDCEEGQVQRRYDSVTGTTGGRKVYITYDNTLAYPAYVITYIWWQ